MPWREEVRGRTGMSVFDIALSIASGIIIALVFVMVLHVAATRGI